MDKGLPSCYTQWAPSDMRRTPWAALWFAGVFLLPACNPPKYVSWSSVQGDYKVMVPWGWRVMTDREGDHFTNTNFIGPFEPEFYLGVPSFSIRWHRNSYSHRLPDGLLEYYSNADDYIRRMLLVIYGPEPELLRPVHEILVAGRKAKHFVVRSPVRVPANAKWGTEIEVRSGELVNRRQHAYVVLPMTKGFYVLVYPATREGFKLYEPQFNQLVNTFAPLQEGPGGPKAEAAVAASGPTSPFPAKR